MMRALQQSFLHGILSSKSNKKTRKLFAPGPKLHQSSL